MGKYNVLIVGAGNIGAYFDSPDTKAVLTHAHAFYLHKEFDILGFVDKDLEKAKNAAKIWGGEAFCDIEEAFLSFKVHVLILALPDPLHFEVAMAMKNKEINFLLIEKPIAMTILEGEILIQEINQMKILAGSNYSRRFVPEIAALQKEIKGFAYGKFLTGTGYYGKVFGIMDPI